MGEWGGGGTITSSRKERGGGGTETEKKVTERERQTERDRDRQRQRHRESDSEREREKGREGERAKKQHVRHIIMLQNVQDVAWNETHPKSVHVYLLSHRTIPAIQSNKDIHNTQLNHIFTQSLYL